MPVISEEVGVRNEEFWFVLLRNTFIDGGRVGCAIAHHVVG